jgi:predicted ATPase
MLVAISGSQGSGKSTVLNRLKELGYNVVERKTSRSILSDWGVTLEQVNNDYELTMRFQDEILRRKFEDEEVSCHGVSGQIGSAKQVWFTERTYADLFTYALITLGKENQYSDYVDSYYDLCKEKQKSYAHVFFIEGGIFDVVHDGVRGSNQHYSMMADITMRKFTWLMSTSSKSFHPITVAHIDDRVDSILEIVYNK